MKNRKFDELFKVGCFNKNEWAVSIDSKKESRKVSKKSNNIVVWSVVEENGPKGLIYKYFGVSSSDFLKV